MSDNVIEFPGVELHVEYTPEPDEDAVERMSNAMVTIAVGARELGVGDWDQAFYGAISAAGFFASQMGLTSDQFLEILGSVEAYEEERPSSDPSGA